jgi:hypothetical protein
MSRYRKRRNRRGPPKRVSLVKRLLRNRYRPGSSWVSLADIWNNTLETAYAWFNRVPPNSRLMWRNGRIVGHSRKWNGPR